MYISMRLCLFQLTQCVNINTFVNKIERILFGILCLNDFQRNIKFEMNFIEVLCYGVLHHGLERETEAWTVEFFQYCEFIEEFMSAVSQ